MKITCSLFRMATEGNAESKNPILSLRCSLFRSILTVPWMELGGKVSVLCKKTGYSAAIEFHCKVRCAFRAFFRLF